MCCPAIWINAFLTSQIHSVFGIKIKSAMTIDTTYFGHYLIALDQSLSLLLAERGAVPPSTLWGARDMLNYFLNLAASLPTLDEPKIIFLSGLVRNREYGSKIYSEFRNPLLAMLQDAPTQSSFYRLSPISCWIWSMNMRRAGMSF
jgi:hypothetical protein